MVRARRIARRRSYSLVFFLDELFVCELFTIYITPEFLARSFVHHLSKRFCKPVCQRLQRDLVIIIMILLETFDMWLDAMDRYGECANIVLDTFFSRCDKIR